MLFLDRPISLHQIFLQPVFLQTHEHGFFLLVWNNLRGLLSILLYDGGPTERYDTPADNENFCQLKDRKTNMQ
jgi:hypothetical protein